MEETAAAAALTVERFGRCRLGRRRWAGEEEGGFEGGREGGREGGAGRCEKLEEYLEGGREEEEEVEEEEMVRSWCEV